MEIKLDEIYKREMGVEKIQIWDGRYLGDEVCIDFYLSLGEL